MADYCNVGGFKCKYCYKGVCDFFCMGSGNTEDMPCVDELEEHSDESTVISYQAFSEICSKCIESNYGNMQITKNVLYGFSRMLSERLFPEHSEDTEDNEE